MKTFTFGKYKGHSIQKIAYCNPDYVRWAIENVNGFSEIAKDIVIPKSSQRHDAIRCMMDEEEMNMPSDHGSDVTDDRGSVIGKRYYRRSSTGDDLECHTIYPDGSGVWHGGMGGDLYYNEFGDT